MSAIEWTDETWNPVTGCDRVSPGCAHCYALDLAARLKAMGQARYQRDGDPRTSGPGFGVTLHEDRLEEPLRWRKPRRVFVNSMSDLFHEEVPDLFIARIFGAMASAGTAWQEPGAHTFQVLTKRPERMAELLQHPQFVNDVKRASGMTGIPWPLPWVWLGVSIENRSWVHRSDVLRATPAAVRFISAEPLLGPLLEPGEGWEDDYRKGGLYLNQIDWVIVGGESGPRARPMRPEWVRDLRDATRRWAADEVTQLDGRHAAFFFKQWGGRTPKAGGRELDGRTWDEFPEPAAAVAA